MHQEIQNKCSHHTPSLHSFIFTELNNWPLLNNTHNDRLGLKIHKKWIVLFVSKLVTVSFKVLATAPGLALKALDIGKFKPQQFNNTDSSRDNKHCRTGTVYLSHSCRTCNKTSTQSRRLKNVSVINYRFDFVFFRLLCSAIVNTIVWFYWQTSKRAVPDSHMVWVCF